LNPSVRRRQTEFPRLSVLPRPFRQETSFCSPQHTDSALYPIIGQMERAAGQAHGDTTQVKLDKLDALLAQTSTSKQDAALFAEMLSLPNDGRYPALNMEPQQRRQKTLDALAWADAATAGSKSSAPALQATLLRKGLALIPQVTDSNRQKEHELDLQIALGLALFQSRGFHTEAAGEAYSRARQLCDELKRPRKLLPILYGQWANSFVGADFDRTGQLATEILNVGEQASDDVVTRVVGYRVTGATSLFRGDFSIARGSLEEGLKLYDQSQRVQYRGLTSVDTYIGLLTYLAPALACCGQLDQAVSLCDKALADARDTSHAPTLAHTLWFTWWSGWCAHSDPSTLLSYVDELVTLSANRELGFWHTAGMVCRGWCWVMLGHGHHGISQMNDGISNLRTTCFGPLVVTMRPRASRRDSREKLAAGRAGAGCRPNRSPAVHPRARACALHVGRKLSASRIACCQRSHSM
jgi:tetratricopeptide (TPR) repeat protein